MNSSVLFDSKAKKDTSKIDIKIPKYNLKLQRIKFKDNFLNNKMIFRFLQIIIKNK